MKNSHQQGLFGKYELKKSDGEPIDPDAVYFILRIDNDTDALHAAMQWAINKSNWPLFNDLRKGYDEY